MLSFAPSSVHGGDTSLHKVGKIFIDMAGIQNCFPAPVPKGGTATVVLQGRGPGLEEHRAETQNRGVGRGEHIGIQESPGSLRERPQAHPVMNSF